MFQALRPKVFHLADGDTSVYYFSSVGAPAEVSAPITHVWEYYDRIIPLLGSFYYNII
jgi:hypothetical protein